eukprot:CAMPEP_0176340612 /NCGR_PEP_ID=MMETSP0126-20121128/1696_1 /TAXON_ID=141414 ORGANISM="Strombidinopsis acuminatum, Strain SPMC142" /NCGR_SAMPLE_ID=MMETSP0126 /ASSEMBLY_ACC=CAM_ASM_000229 /LENGTH=79 /DNA_ID=CAMNT_0017684891 /DNA_START=1123 /DNA_END=1362 /DNA_ORIENTATION=+
MLASLNKSKETLTQKEGLVNQQDDIDRRIKALVKEHTKITKEIENYEEKYGKFTMPKAFEDESDKDDNSSSSEESDNEQ